MAQLFDLWQGTCSNCPWQSDPMSKELAKNMAVAHFVDNHVEQLLIQREYKETI